MPSVAVIIPAAGQSSRFGGREKKPFASPCGGLRRRCPGQIKLDVAVFRLRLLERVIHPVGELLHAKVLHGAENAVVSGDIRMIEDLVMEA